MLSLLALVNLWIQTWREDDVRLLQLQGNPGFPDLFSCNNIFHDFTFVSDYRHKSEIMGHSTWQHKAKWFLALRFVRVFFVTWFFDNNRCMQALTW
jgi:hypothetical protein